ncbi:hypothetical protein ABBQ38_005988 [Trebouxia sp. C0009 RCD-2024]
MNDAAQDAAGRLHTQITLPKVTRTQNYQHVNGKLTNLRNRVDPSIRCNPAFEAGTRQRQDPADWPGK